MMNSMVYLIPLSLALGLVWLLVFFWTLRRDQYDDLDGAAERILYDDDKPVQPLPATNKSEGEADQTLR